MSDPHRQLSVLRLIIAMNTGATAEIEELLAKNPGLARDKLDGNERTSLHHATDWPGHKPTVARSIELLVASGADVHAVFPHPEGGSAETPLHFAASSNDVEALDALLDAGADIDAVGGVIQDCAPFEEAVIFQHYAAASRLLERGAQTYLAGIAALNRLDLVGDFFDRDGKLRTDVGRLPNWNVFPPSQVVLDRALQFACSAGHLEMAQFIHARGGDPASISPVNTTPLDGAMKGEHHDVVAWLLALG